MTDSARQAHIMCVGGTAITSWAGRHDKFIRGSGAFASPIQPSILSMPMVHWMTEPDRQGRHRVYTHSMSGSLYPLLRLVAFGDLGTGYICLLDPSVQAAFATIVHAADHPAKSAWANWRSKRHVTKSGLFVCPSDVAKYCWKSNDGMSPPQHVLYDPFSLRSLDQRKRPSAATCWSTMHRGPSTDTAPFSAFIFEKDVCSNCFEANCTHAKGSQMGLLGRMRPRSAKEIFSDSTPAIKARVHTMLSTVKRVYCFAALDSAMSIDYSDKRATNVHGTAVSLLWYCFPQVYSVRQHSLSIGTERPLRGLRRFWLMSGGAHHAKHKMNIKKVGTIATSYSDAFVNAGRARTTIAVGERDDRYFMPWVQYDAALATGVRPWHEFVTLSNVYLTRAFARVVHALHNGALALTITLLPPVSADELVPALSKAALQASVTMTPTLKRSADADTAYRAYAGCYYDGHCLTWEWLDMMLDLNQVAAEAHDLPAPRLELTIAGSFYRAMNRPTLIKRGGVYESIRVGGVFQELVELWKPLDVFGSRLTVVCGTHNDAVMYSTHASSDFIAAMIRIERRYLANPAGTPLFSSIAQCCDLLGQPCSSEHVDHDPMLTPTLARDLGKLVFHDSASIRMGTDDYTRSLVDAARKASMMPTCTNYST